MKIIRKFIPYIALSGLLPLLASAQSIPVILSTFQNTLNTVIGILFLIATVVFLWGVIKFIMSAGDEKKRSAGKGMMTWGIIGLAVMAAAWGIANLLIGYFGIQGQTPNRVLPPTYRGGTGVGNGSLYGDPSGVTQ